jgi:pimeloyl-ACP methyl ester carboxylesterase
MSAADSDDVVVEVAGVPITVQRRGSGPDVLFIHGFYINGTVWDDVVATLEDSVTCWIPTLPLGGHASPLPTSWSPTLDLLGGMVVDLIAALDLSDVTVVGNDSGGGFVLLALGSERPELARITRVVLTNCDSFEHFPPTDFLPLIELAGADPATARTQIEPMLHTSAGRDQFAASIAARPLSRDRINALFAPLDVLDDAVKVTAALAPTPALQEMAWLPDVHIPVDLVWGDADDFFPLADCDRLAAAIPHATVTIIPGAKTYTQLDAPADVARVIRKAAGQ